jgi:hypothetical protein
VKLRFYLRAINFHIHTNPGLQIGGSHEVEIAFEIKYLSENGNSRKLSKQIGILKLDQQQLLPTKKCVFFYHRFQLEKGEIDIEAKIW